MPVVPTRFASGDADALFAELRKSPVLVHHPYDSFARTFEWFVRTSATDPRTVAVKTTVYRTSDDSPHVPALIEAAEEGKQTVCLVELKARFDERRNIEWSRALESAGVHVVYGFPDMKIHAKGTLIVRREADGGLRRYAHIGTGNYNAVTARLYEDFSLFTGDEDVTADLADLFNYLTGFGRPQRFRKLLVAPFTMRSGLVEHIRACAAAAEAGKQARIRIKVNHLADEEIVTRALRGRGRGRRVEIFARTTCTLWPRAPRRQGGHPVRTLLGRFFEHSRFFIFEADGESTFLLGQRRPDAAQPRPPDRDPRPGRGRPRPARAHPHVRLDHGGHPLVVGAARRRHLGAGPWEEGQRGQSLHGALMRRAARAGAGVRTPSHAPADCQPTRWEEWSACESQSSTWERTRSACWSPSRTGRQVAAVHEEREQLGLGEEVERYGYISAREVRGGREVARAQTRRARRLGCERIEIVVTSPGRQSGNSDEFADALARGTGVPVRILSGGGGRGAGLGRRGGRARATRPESVAVCDVGGGSAQLVVGTLRRGRRGCARSISARCG